MDVLVTGATGILGRNVTQVLESRGHTVRAGSRHPQGAQVHCDLLDAASIEAACDGVDAIVHCATDIGKGNKVDVAGVHLLRAAAPDARIVYPSIVGCDRIRFGYYRTKVRAEQALTGDHAIVRLTQFHEFPELLARLPMPIVPAGMKTQPIASEEAAAIVADAVEVQEQGNLGDFGGPEVHRMKDLMRDVLREDGRRRPIIPLPFGYKGFRAGHNLCPDRKVGRITWALHRAG